LTKFKQKKDIKTDENYFATLELDFFEFCSSLLWK